MRLYPSFNAFTVNRFFLGSLRVANGGHHVENFGYKFLEIANLMHEIAKALSCEAYMLKELL